MNTSLLWYLHVRKIRNGKRKLASVIGSKLKDSFVLETKWKRICNQQYQILLIDSIWWSLIIDYLSWFHRDPCAKPDWIVEKSMVYEEIETVNITNILEFYFQLEKINKAVISEIIRLNKYFFFFSWEIHSMFLYW